MKKLFAIFVNFNSGDQLFRGVRSVLNFPEISGIIIVDNGSSDNSLVKAEKLDQKKVSIIKNQKNLGFYKAVNLGIKKAIELGADGVMPLDFDLDFDSNFIKKLVKVQADVVAPVLKFKRNNKWVFDYGGRINWLIGRSTHLEKSSPIRPTVAAKSTFDRKNINRYDFVSGGATIIKKAVLDKIGLLDEDYFVYYGDTDFTIKAARAGFKVVADPNTIVHHKLEITKKTRNIKKLRIALSDNLTFIKKNVPWYFKLFAYGYIGLLSLKVALNLYI